MADDFDLDLEAALAGLDDQLLSDTLDVETASLESELLLEEMKLLAEIDPEAAAAMQEEKASSNLKNLVAKNKAQAEARKKKEEEEKMKQYMSEEAQASEAEKAMKERIERRKKELASKKAQEEEDQMKKYMEEEKASEAASSAMKERIAARKKELASQKKSEEDEQMRKYLEEEQAAELAAAAMKERIAAHKKDLAGKKKDQEDEQMRKYLEEERAAEEAAAAMKERIASHKKDLAGKKKDQEDEQMRKYLEEEQSAEAAAAAMKERIAAHKKELAGKKKDQEDEQMRKYLEEEQAAEAAAAAMKERIANRKKELASTKKDQEDDQMRKYLDEEAIAESAAAAMKERIAARKKELASTKKDQEDDQMKKYLEEERAAEAASAAMRERIANRKKELASQKKDMEDEQMKKYMEEERAAEEAASAMKARIAQRKTELSSQKKSEEDDQMRKYMEEERAAEEAAAAMKDRINARKKELEYKKKKEEEDSMKKYMEEEQNNEAASKAMKTQKFYEKKQKESAQVNTFVKTITGVNYPLVCSPDLTVASYKLLVAARSGIPSESLSLIYNDTIMEENRTLAQSGVIAQSEILMVRAVVYDPIQIKNPDSWKKWHERQTDNWTCFEEKHFQEGSYFMEKWNRDRMEILQKSLAKQMATIQQEAQENAFCPEFSKKETNAIVKPLPKNQRTVFKTVGIDLYQSYLTERELPSFSSLSSFYFDAAVALFDAGLNEKAVRVLSNLAEIELDNPQFLRLIAFKLEEQGVQYSLLTIEILRRVLKLRPEEPHSALYLMYAMARNAKQLMTKDEKGRRGDLSGVLALTENDGVLYSEEVAKKRFVDAVDLANKVIMGKWDTRFAQVEVTAVTDLNRLINYADFYGFHHELKQLVDGRLMAPIMVDLRVLLLWDTDMTDVQLHVTEPSGEECYSFHNKTTGGGMLSRDFTKGYGPEEYLIRSAEQGTYRVSVKLFNSFSRYTGTTVQVRIWTYFADPQKEKEHIYTVRLQTDCETRQVADIVFV